jgi:hypothetical protein
MSEGEKLDTSYPKVGERAKFFHPRTLGVMHYGSVVAVNTAGVLVHFEVDDKKYWTFPDRIA